MLRLYADSLSRLPGIAHAFFGRTGGVSAGIFSSLNCGPGSGDARDKVIENRRRALASLTPSPDASVLTMYQIHSAEVAIVRESWEIGNAPRADAMVTNLRGLALGILTADCAPVLLADTEAGVIGAAHAGWKGALAGVVESAIAGMERLGARRQRIASAIGPCISQANYEVGPDLRGQFVAADRGNADFFIESSRPDRWQLDLAGYIVHRLMRAGIESIERISACTYAQDSDFFSFRRATHRREGDYGRQLSAILLTRQF